jgi:AAA ATPase-like protein
MKLTRFRVTGFRSVEDSGWIEVDDVTAFVGVNESGKTNLLLPLWKLNPANDGEVDPTADYPRKRYNEIRSDEVKPDFITAEFLLDPELQDRIADLTGSSPEELSVVRVARDYDNEYTVSFPLAVPSRTADKKRVLELLTAAKIDLESAMAAKSEQALKSELLAAVDRAILDVKGLTDVTVETFAAISEHLSVDTDRAIARSKIKPRFERLIDEIDEIGQEISAPSADDSQEAADLILEKMPSFVYYSNYGNLDSEIYLPHVIENLQRDDLGLKEEAKARTLKVLFEFVRLSPNEIRELGRDFKPPTNQPNLRPTAEQIEEIAEKKKQRSILLQSAGTELTKKFRNWWKQGEYRFRFEADGDHFRIWVSDEKRPEEIELEGRSTGLQWFLSFYLIFLVESANENAGAILLLDEPGHSLHPLSQRDLSEFFTGLSQDNQLLFTTHSPFMVDGDRLDRVKAVFIQEDGSTGVSPDLRAGTGRSAAAISQSRSIYPVHAALGLTVSDTLLQGCTVVIVEGISDQQYLVPIKNLLVGAGRITPSREIVFLPAGGVRGIGPIVSIVGGKEGALPMVLLDGDQGGREFAEKLRSGLYHGEKERVQLVTNYTNVQNAEIEDLVPYETMVAAASRWLRGPEEDFADFASPTASIIGQIEAYAKKYDIALPSPGWKVELARVVRPRLSALDLGTVPENIVNAWTSIFAQIESSD